MNRYVWDFREDGPTAVPGMFILELADRGGPLVPPGKYQIKLNVNGRNYSAPLEIKAEPRVRVSQEDFEKQYELASKIRDRISEIHAAVNEIRARRGTLEALRKTAGSSKAQQIADIESKMAEIEGRLIQVDSVNLFASLVKPIMLDAAYADLANAVESADAAPTTQEYTVFQEYEHQAEALLERWKSLLEEIKSIQSQ